MSVVLEGLLDSLERAQDPLENGCSDIGPSKATLLTLHALYPNILLPALDLLDRHLITRLVCRERTDTELERVGEAHQALSKDAEKDRSVYYVHSSAPQPSRRRATSRLVTDTTNYEVRTTAWSCTCPAFTYAVFSREIGRPYEGDSDSWRSAAENAEDPVEWVDASRWGGLIHCGLGEDVPICKHLFACVLVERWAVARSMIEEKEVGREEMAGWAAGWGG